MMMLSNDEASAAFGWMSIACWVIVYSPQIIENYKLQSGEGLSVFFVIIWLLGDLTNLVGASMAGLLPTIILLACYYTLCDVILLVQIYYYRYKNPSIHDSDPKPPNTETSPLLASASPAPNQPLPFDPKPTTFKSILSNTAIQYFLGASLVIGAGVAACVVKRSSGAGGDGPKGPEDVIEFKSQILGWTSAALYIGSRLPQIKKNRKTKCEGLSLALFVFAVVGNLTYVLSICAASMTKRHLIANASWLAGSGLIIILDFIVLYQFFHYRPAREALARSRALGQA